VTCPNLNGSRKTVAFVLLSYTEDAPAGLERSVASLLDGLRCLGHRALVITAAGKASGHDPDTIPLSSVSVPDPATEDDLLAAVPEPGQVCRELRELLARERADVVCWADASWGLGYLAPAPGQVATVLKVAALRADALFDQALSRNPDVVVASSPFTVDAARDAGYDTAGWAVVPNALLNRAQPPAPQRREELRRSGPVRIVARAEPHKGIRELLDSMPGDIGRSVEVVLAAAGFEYWPGMQDEVITGCRAAAGRASGDVRILPALPWRDVPGFFAGAAVTIICTTSPEPFCNTAAEALSAGTPVTGYSFGHVPVLAGPAGVMVDPVPPGEPATSLWDATVRLLADHHAYHAASLAAPGQVTGHTPAASAQAFLNAVLTARPPHRR
jgi:glycosyltransferase involved in cell wall biosynthesis